jgi:hypothetical protein
MFDSIALEVAIGLALAFLMFSLLLTSLQEGIEAMMKGRAKDLEKTIKQLLDDQTGKLTELLYEHPLIYSLFPGDYGSARSKRGLTTSLPSYIPKGHFAAALADILAGNFYGRPKPHPKGEGTTKATDVPVQASDQVVQVFKLANNASGGRAEFMLAGVEQWYDAAMSRLSGQYKRKTQVWLFILALIFAWLCNVDAIRIGTELAMNQQLRQKVIAEAPAVRESSEKALAALGRIKPADASQAQLVKSVQIVIESGRSQMVAAGLPVGRKAEEGMWSVSVRQVTGWLITALAAMLGAPFWFDLLGKFMNVRSALKPATDAAAASAVSGTNAFAGAIAAADLVDLEEVEQDCCGGWSPDEFEDSGNA